MILKHIPQRTHSIVESTPSSNVDLLCYRNLDMVNKISIPKRSRKANWQTERS
jgi:hypothetical protein